MFAAIPPDRYPNYGYHGEDEDYVLMGVVEEEDVYASQYLSSAADQAHRKRVLDIGTGAGAFLLACLEMGYEAQGITAHDYSQHPMYAYITEQLPPDAYIVADAHDLDAVPGVGDEYDLVIGHNAFLHFVDPLGSLEQAANKVAPGGVLAVSDCAPLRPVYSGQSSSRDVIDALETARFDTTGSNYDPDSTFIGRIIAKRSSEPVVPVRFPVAYSPRSPFRA